MSERSVISVRELPPVPRPVFDPVLRCYTGEPWYEDPEKGDYWYNIPGIPHIHPAYVSLQYADGSVSSSRKPVNVITAHGTRSNDGEWVFNSDFRPVKDVIDSYNVNHVDAPIECAMVCNPSPETYPGILQPINAFIGYQAFRDEGATLLSLKLKDPARGSFQVPEGMLTSF